MSRIGLVTCREIPEPDHDEEILHDALRGAGLEPRLIAWDDPDADPGAFDLCILRSCWNYHEAPDDFLRWLDGAERRTRVLNPPDVVRWNLHKRYLGELADAELPIVPTEWHGRGDSVDLAATMERRGWADVVVKPAVSAASYRTRRFRRAEVAAGQAFLDALLGDRDALVQPTLPGFAEPGERAIVWIAGDLTHAVRKAPRFDADEERVSAASGITDEERTLARRALALVPGDLLYGRVDLVQGPDGALAISELEVIEPSLFLIQSSSALDRFVQGILHHR